MKVAGYPYRSTYEACPRLEKSVRLRFLGSRISFTRGSFNTADFRPGSGGDATDRRGDSRVEDWDSTGWMAAVDWSSRILAVFRARGGLHITGYINPFLTDRNMPLPVVLSLMSLVGIPWCVSHPMVQVPCFPPLFTLIYPYPCISSSSPNLDLVPCTLSMGLWRYLGGTIQCSCNSLCRCSPLQVVYVSGRYHSRIVSDIF